MGGIGPTGAIGGSEQQYALKWNDFHASILNSFRHLRDEEDFIDVTIACDGFSFTAHKVVLSACSPYFRSLLKANPCQHPIVILRDVRKQDMEALLRFMYNGEVHIGQEQLPDFLKTAQTLQVRGLADVSTKDQHKLTSNTSTSIPWSSNLTDDDSQSLHNSTKLNSVDNPPPSKKLRTSEHQHSDSRYSESPPLNRDSSNDNLDHKPPIADTLLTQTLHEGTTPLNNSNALKTVSEPSSQIHSSNEDSNNSYDDEASDAEGTENGQNSVTDLAQPKLEPPDFALGDRSRNDSLMSPALFDPQRGRNSYGSGLFNIQGIAGLIPGPSGMHNNSQDSYGMMRRSSEAGKVRATDPRPCPKCGKIYRSAHTLRTHLEDKHTICPGYRCVLCGTVAKSRNSLHSHMSRQHRGISTKDLPVLPMPSPFDPELASKLYMKAGIKMSPAELRARASPTGTITPLRRSDTRLDAPSSDNNNCSGDDDPQDLSMNSSHKYGSHLAPSPLDFHQNPAVNSKLNLLSSLVGNDKENRGLSITPMGSTMMDAYLQLLTEGKFGGPEQMSAAEMTAKLVAQQEWVNHQYGGVSNNEDDECSTSQDELSEDEPEREPIKAE